MRLFSEKVSPTFNSSGYNILTVKDFSEVFFDVYEFEINGSKFVAEKTGVQGDAPIVSIPVTYQESVTQYDFVLHKGEQSIHFDPSTKSIPSTLPVHADIIIAEDQDEVLLEDRRSLIIEEINKAKAAAVQYLTNLDEQNRRKLATYQTEKEIALKEDIDKQKQILFDEFQSFITNLRNDLLESDTSNKEVLGQIIISELNEASKHLDTQLESIENAIESKLDERAMVLLNDILLVEIERSCKSISENLDNRVASIEQSLNNSLAETKNEIASNITEKLQEITTELNAKDCSIVELNNTLNKQSNKALSRIGTVKTQLEESLSSAVNLLESRIDSASEKLEEYYTNKINVVEEAMASMSEETRQHVIDLIKESKSSLLEEINNIKITVPNIVIEKSNGNQEIDVPALKTELEKSVSNRFVNEIASLKRLIELSSGGGSVAMQFANGGTMNGNLTVTGTISASQYLGLSIPSGEYLPLSGGTVTGDVSISGLLSANRIQMNTIAGLPASEGQLTWNDQDGTLNIGLKGGNVTLQVGQEQVARVVNKTGANLFESEYRAVRIRSTAEGGTQGQRLAIVLAQANNDPNSVDTLGLVTEDIAVNQEGFVTTSGLVRNINTTGTLQSETWSDGDVLYLSPFTAGRLTNIKPQAPNHTVIMGFVVYKHQNQGSIYVKVDNGYELDELHNVKINNLSGGNVLAYDSTQNVWTNTNTLSISSLSASNILLNGNRVATVVDPVRTTLTGNGILSSFAIAGAGSLTNPSALIVAIDGALQEPSVDYTVSGGNITFTDPLANGAKAVVIAPTNTLQVGELVPSDGSVTSAKLAPNLTLTNPTFGGTAAFTGTSRPTSSATESPAANSLLTRADAVALPHLSRRLFPNMSASTSGAGATQRRTVGAGLFDGDLSTSAVEGSIYRINILSPGTGTQTLNSLPASGVVNLSAPWSLFLRGFLTIGNNAHVYLCLGTLGASGIPTTGTGVGFEIQSATNIRLFRNNGGPAVFSTSGTITGISAASPTSDFLIWLDNDGAGNLSLFYAIKPFSGGMPLKPVSPLCTLTGVASSTSGSEASIFLRATATSPSISTALGIRDCIFTEF